MYKYENTTCIFRLQFWIIMFGHIINIYVVTKTFLTLLCQEHFTNISFQDDSKKYKECIFHSFQIFARPMKCCLINISSINIVYNYIDALIKNLPDQHLVKIMSINIENIENWRQ